MAAISATATLRARIEAALTHAASNISCVHAHAISTGHRPHPQHGDRSTMRWRHQVAMTAHRGNRASTTTTIDASPTALEEAVLLACQLVAEGAPLGLSVEATCSVTHSAPWAGPQRSQEQQESDGPSSPRPVIERVRKALRPDPDGVFAVETATILLFLTTCGMERESSTARVGVLARWNGGVPTVLSRYGPSWNDLDIQDLVREATLRLSEHDMPIRPHASGNGRLVLSPTATARLLSMLRPADLMPSNRAGQELCELIDDPNAEGGLIPRQFDANGDPTRRTYLEARGLAISTAPEIGVPRWFEYEAGPTHWPTNLYLEPSQATPPEEILSEPGISIIFELEGTGTQRMRFGHEIRFSVPRRAMLPDPENEMRIATRLDRVLSGIEQASAPVTFHPGEISTGGSWLAIAPSAFTLRDS